MKAYQIIPLVFLASCAFNRDEGSKDTIKGFWHVTAVTTSDVKRDTTVLYIEINDTTLIFWQEHVAYLPPYGYEIVRDTLMNWLYEDSLSRRVVVGKIHVISDTLFTITNSRQKLNFSKSSLEDFRRENGLRWLIDH